MHICNKHLCFC